MADVSLCFTYANINKDNKPGLNAKVSNLSSYRILFLWGFTCYISYQGLYKYWFLCVYSTRFVCMILVFLYSFFHRLHVPFLFLFSFEFHVFHIEASQLISCLWTKLPSKQKNIFFFLFFFWVFDVLYFLQVYYFVIL